MQTQATHGVGGESKRGVGHWALGRATYIYIYIYGVRSIYTMRF